MSTHCQPLPRPLVEELLQVVARAICDKPGDNPAQRESRTNQMVHSVLGFEPRDGLEYMLSTIAFGHFQMILDSMRDVFLGQTETMKAKTKTTIVALDRAMLEMIRELRVVRRRPLARAMQGSAEDVAQKEADQREADQRAADQREADALVEASATEAMTPADETPASAPAPAARPEADTAPAASHTARTDAGTVGASAALGATRAAGPRSSAGSPEGAPASAQSAAGSPASDAAAYRARFASVMAALERQQVPGEQPRVAEAATGD